MGNVLLLTVEKALFLNSGVAGLALGDSFLTEESFRWPLEGPLFIGILQKEHFSPVRLHEEH